MVPPAGTTCRSGARRHCPAVSLHSPALRLRIADSPLSRFTRPLFAGRACPGCARAGLGARLSLAGRRVGTTVHWIVLGAAPCAAAWRRALVVRRRMAARDRGQGVAHSIGYRCRGAPLGCVLSLSGRCAPPPLPVDFCRQRVAGRVAPAACPDQAARPWPWGPLVGSSTVSSASGSRSG